MIKGSHSLAKNSTVTGMTLIELLAVVAIIGVLAALVFGLYGGARDRSLSSATQAQLAHLRVAIEKYERAFGFFPQISTGDPGSSSQTLLRALTNETGSATELGAFVNPIDLEIESSKIVDGWGRPIYYRFDSNWSHGQFFLMSTGKDGVASLPNSAGQYDPDNEYNLDNLEGFDL
jgi:prepilin-type N-terminal cleavage/methylation domain-containing protein